MPWDGETIHPDDEFEAISRVRGGAAPKGVRDPFSPKNARRRFRRQQPALLAKEERRRAREAAAEDEERHMSATTIIFEEEEFITTSFVDRVWDRSTTKSFFRWTRSFSGSERDE
jgi:hypothetical protein